MHAQITDAQRTLDGTLHASPASMDSVTDRELSSLAAYSSRVGRKILPTHVDFMNPFTFPFRP